MNRNPLLGATVAVSAVLVLTACGPQRVAAQQAGAGQGSPTGSASVVADTPISVSPTASATPSPTEAPSTPAPSPTASPVKGANAALAAAEAKWKAAGLSSYSYTYALRCFCPRNMDIVTVKDGKVVSATPTGPDKAKEAKPVLANLPTVDTLFVQLHEAYEGGHAGEFAGPAAKVQVSYDAKYGFPTSAYIDWSDLAMDEEAAYSATDFKPLVEG